MKYLKVYEEFSQQKINMTKSEFYSNLIKIQKQTGQGLSGIVKIKSTEYAQYLDELIMEGLVKACHTGGSIGHEESNIFYVPTSGYNVWEDDGVDGVDGEWGRHKGRYLNFLRLYLGINEESPINPKSMDYLQNPEVMKEYSDWLTRNNKELKEMLDLDDFYKEVSVTLTPVEINWLKSRGWYIENEIVGKCLKASIDFINRGDYKKAISINKSLIDLYRQSERSNPGKYKDKLKEAEEEIENVEVHMTYRKRINSWLKDQDQKVKIKSII